MAELCWLTAHAADHQPRRLAIESKRRNERFEQKKDSLIIDGAERQSVTETSCCAALAKQSRDGATPRQVQVVLADDRRWSRTARCGAQPSRPPTARQRNPIDIRIRAQAAPVDRDGSLCKRALEIKRMHMGSRPSRINGSGFEFDQAAV